MLIDLAGLVKQALRASISEVKEGIFVSAGAAKKNELRKGMKPYRPNFERGGKKRICPE
jgi:hypothetical protein